MLNVYFRMTSITVAKAQLKAWIVEFCAYFPNNVKQSKLGAADKS